MTTDKNLDTIYDICDFLMREEMFEMVDDLLELVYYNVTRVYRGFDEDELLGFLTVTLPAKSRLKNREKLKDIIDSSLTIGL